MKPIYPPCLENYMRERYYDTYIPRKIKDDERLRIFKRYYQVYQELYFKVIDIYHENDIEYYSIRHHDNMNDIISYPLENTYEMMIDKNDIVNLEEIINTEISYTGAEIKFWFFHHNIDFDSEKYEKFYSYLVTGSKSEISDEKYYFVRANINYEGNYRKCRFSLDKSRLLEAEKRRKRHDRNQR